jgi:hypothetical protein
LSYMGYEGGRFRPGAPAGPGAEPRTGATVKSETEL